MLHKNRHGQSRLNAGQVRLEESACAGGYQHWTYDSLRHFYGSCAF